MFLLCTTVILDFAHVATPGLPKVIDDCHGILRRSILREISMVVVFSLRKCIARAALAWIQEGVRSIAHRGSTAFYRVRVFDLVV